MPQSGLILEYGAFRVKSPKALRHISSGISWIREKEEQPSVHYSFCGIQNDSATLLGRKISPSAGHDQNEANSVVFKGHPVFFDQTNYFFIIHIKDAVNARIFSHLASWCDASDWDEVSKQLTININFANDLGDFILAWEWETKDGQNHTASFSSRVLSTKLDVYRHVRPMMEDIEQEFAWTKLDFLRQTTWAWNYDDNKPKTNDSWLVIFQELQKDLVQAFFLFIKRHRRLLRPQSFRHTADRIKKTSAALEEQVAERIHSNPEEKFIVTRKILSPDIPENQFIKHLLDTIYADLFEIIQYLSCDKRISDIFKEFLNECHAELGHLKTNRFWKEISSFSGLRGESLILSQDPVYSGIRRAWIRLQSGLSLFETSHKGGIQDIASLYEAWCFVSVHSILRSSGWYRVDGKNPDLNDSNILLQYKRNNADEITVELLFQATAGQKPRQDNTWKNIISIPNTQKPDIVLRLRRNDLPYKPVYTWIFDAKYRIDNNRPPEDAVNEMHRYRDAIVNRALEPDKPMVREAAGGYILFPGAQDTTATGSIDRVNIGAFPLSPDEVPESLSSHISKILKTDYDFEGILKQEKRIYGNVPKCKPVLKGSVISVERAPSPEATNWQNDKKYTVPYQAGIEYRNWEFFRQTYSEDNAYLYPILWSEIIVPDNSLVLHLGKPLSAPDNLNELPFIDHLTENGYQLT